MMRGDESVTLLAFAAWLDRPAAPTVGFSSPLG